jgi:hypothetical protein
LDREIEKKYVYELATIEIGNSMHVMLDVVHRLTGRISL